MIVKLLKTDKEIIRKITFIINLLKTVKGNLKNDSV